MLYTLYMPTKLHVSSLLCIQSSWWYINGMTNGYQGKMLNMLYMYILIYWWNKLIFRAAINWFSNHSRKTTLFISWWWSPSFDLARNTKSQQKIGDNRRVLYDQVFIINYRCNYLRKIKSFREAGYDIVYMDENRIFYLLMYYWDGRSNFPWI
jgi:hypothetical protein